MAASDYTLTKHKYEVGQCWFCAFNEDGPHPSRVIPYTVVAKIMLEDNPLIIMVNNASGTAVSFGEDGFQHDWKDSPHGLFVVERSRRKPTVQISG